MLVSAAAAAAAPHGRQSEVSTDIQIDLEEFEELWVEKAEKVAAKKKVMSSRGGCGGGDAGGRVGGEYYYDDQLNRFP